MTIEQMIQEIRRIEKLIYKCTTSLKDLRALSDQDIRMLYKSYVEDEAALKSCSKKI